jgi:hypothetical protein
MNSSRIILIMSWSSKFIRSFDLESKNCMTEPGASKLSIERSIKSLIMPSSTSIGPLSRSSSLSCYQTITDIAGVVLKFNMCWKKGILFISSQIMDCNA